MIEKGEIIKVWKDIINEIQYINKQASIQTKRNKQTIWPEAAVKIDQTKGPASKDEHLPKSCQTHNLVN